MLNKWGDWTGARFDRRFLIIVCSILLIVGTYFWHLGSLPLQSQESGSLTAVSSIHQITADPTNAPHGLVEFGLQHYGHTSPFLLRSVSVVFCLIFIACFYFIAKFWFGSFCAWLGTLLFAFTPFLILAGRSADSPVMYLFPLSVIAAYMWYARSKNPAPIKFILLLLLGGLSLYEPGGIIFVVLAVIYVRKVLAESLATLPKWASAAGIILFVACLASLVLAGIDHTHVLKSMVLVPANFPHVIDLAKSIGWSLAAIFGTAPGIILSR